MDVDSEEARAAASWLLKNIPVHIEGNTLFPAMHESLTELFKQRDIGQRERCVDKMLSELSSGSIKLVIDEAQLRKACLNATGEGDG